MDPAELAEVRRVRGVPSALEGMGLAERLSGREALAAIRLVSRDAVAVGRAAAGLGAGATVDAVARVTGGDLEAVRAALRELRGVGVAWPEGEVVRLVPSVVERWRKGTGASKVTGAPAVEPGRGGSEGELRSAVQHLLRSAYALLDANRPIIGLRRGGVGVKEQERLREALGVERGHLVLVLDVLFAAGLLTQNGSLLEVTARCERWRDAAPARQWAELAWAWLRLPHSPTARRNAAVSKIESSHARAARWAVLRAARGGLSVDGVAAAAHWFCPAVHEHVDGVVREAEVVGVVTGDALSVCRKALLSADDVEGLAASVADVVLPMPCEVEIFDDLKAVVFGQLTREAARVLDAAAESVVEDGARVWRFTPAGVRAAFARGWTAESLLAELEELTQQNVPWALRVLLGERGRGHVRVREVACCVVAEADVIAEVVRLPGFVELAPTVVGSAMAPAEVVAVLRAEGFAVAEEPGGVAVRRRKAVRTTAGIVRKLNGELSDEAVALLAGAVDGQSDVCIDYVDGKGDSTRRTITPIGWEGPFLLAWCHLREAERQFRVERIKAVAQP